MFPKHSRSRAADTGLEMVMTKAANTNKQDLQECGGWSRRQLLKSQQRAQNPSSRPLRAAEKKSPLGTSSYKDCPVSSGQLWTHIYMAKAM